MHKGFATFTLQKVVGVVVKLDANIFFNEIPLDSDEFNTFAHPFQFVIECLALASTRALQHFHYIRWLGL